MNGEGVSRLILQRPSEYNRNESLLFVIFTCDLYFQLGSKRNSSEF